MKLDIIEDNLSRLYKDAYKKQIDDTDRIVIMSDLHLGDGGKRDAFLINADLVEHVLRDYYMANRFTLVLNGDIEELHRFDLDPVMKRWKHMYTLFNRFADSSGLYKIIGNHDYLLHYRKMPELKGHLLHAMRLEYRDNTLFVFHGHQATGFTEKGNRLARFVLRYLANPLRIKARTAARNPEKRIRVENAPMNFHDPAKLYPLSVTPIDHCLSHFLKLIH